MRLFDKNGGITGTNCFGKKRLLPRQTASDKFPILTYGNAPKISKDQWHFVVWGLVEEEKDWTWDEIMKLPQTRLRADFHCVTHWSRFDDEWGGYCSRI